MTKKTVSFFKIEYIIIFLFSISAVLYANIDKVPLTHPGNIKAADGFYHALIIEGILETKQWNYYDLPFSLGQEKASNSQPPLFYIVSAILTTSTGIPAWATFYMLICISQALFVLIVFLIAKEIFEDEKTALLAACLAMLPLPVSVWLYPLYIGLWLQVPSNMFMMAFLWLFIRYMKRREDWTLIFMSICISSVMGLHPQDLFVLAPAVLVLGFVFLKHLIKEKKPKTFFKKSIFLLLIPFILFIVFLPKIIFVWGAQGESQLKLGFYGIRSVYFSREYAGGMVYPDIFFMPWLLIILFLLGIIQMAINFKKYKMWLAVNIYAFFLFYVTPCLFLNPYYFVRIRTLTPYLMIPTIAYAIFFLIIKHFKRYKYGEGAAIFLIALPAFLYAAPQYNAILQDMSYEHISPEEWDAYKWIHEYSEKTDKVLFFGSVFQQEFLYTKRVTGLFEMSEMQRIVEEFIKTNTTPTLFNGHWAGETVRTVHVYERSFFDFGKYEEPSKILNISDFDYVVFQHISPEIAQINMFFAQEYVKNFGFKDAYYKNGYIILKNEKR